MYFFNLPRDILKKIFIESGKLHKKETNKISKISLENKRDVEKQVAKQTIIYLIISVCIDSSCKKIPIQRIFLRNKINVV